MHAGRDCSQNTSLLFVQLRFQVYQGKQDLFKINNQNTFYYRCFLQQDVEMSIWCGHKLIMMASWHGNAFRITVPLWGESTVFTVIQRIYWLLVAAQIGSTLKYQYQVARICFARTEKYPITITTYCQLYTNSISHPIKLAHSIMVYFYLFRSYHIEDFDGFL